VQAVAEQQVYKFIQMVQFLPLEHKVQLVTVEQELLLEAGADHKAEQAEQQVRTELMLMDLTETLEEMVFMAAAEAAVAVVETVETQVVHKETAELAEQADLVALELALYTFNN
jgi:hypothetical protein